MGGGRRSSVVTELARFSGRKASVREFAQAFNSAGTDQQAQLALKDVKEAMKKNQSLFSFSRSIAHDNVLCNSLDKSIASAAVDCANRSGDDGIDACNRAGALVKLHNDLDCGSNHITKDQAESEDLM